MRCGRLLETQRLLLLKDHRCGDPAWDDVKQLPDTTANNYDFLE